VFRINRRIQARKGFISYYKTDGISSVKNHVDLYHSFIAQMFEEVNNLLKRTEKKDRHQRKEHIHVEGQSLNFLCQRYLQKRRCVTKEFLEDLGQLIANNNLPI
jgi:ribosomal protein L16 Arg81 hydroxylase